MKAVFEELFICLGILNIAVAVLLYNLLFAESASASALKHRSPVSVTLHWRVCIGLAPKRDGAGPEQGPIQAFPDDRRYTAARAASTDS